ncbi:hypothetical protein LPJ53_004401 [Coemansia erecta]|uniref:LAA1-like C-terminal TPR repeats domain-containing protein n=1 Tax=Coemansia erecta TaxID=147472 RepID=A0A9W8CQY4_9FUNG|nr:hypothetical protein LPJ53_004401 [Coemansia erecta]
MTEVALEFDHQRYAALPSPGDREMFLFKWLSALDAHLEAAPESAQAAIKIGDRQQQLELLLLEIAAIPPPPPASSTAKRRSWLGPAGPAHAAAEPTGVLGAAVPSPSRVVRDLVARCLARLYELGHMHRIGDALHLLQTALTRKTSSNAANTRPVRSALVCVGALFESLAATAGFRLLSSFVDFAAAAVRLARTADVSVRVDATRALARMLRSQAAATLLQERSAAVARDLVKCLRANVRHKSPALVVASAEALVALPTRLIGRPPDVERLVAALVPLLATRVLVVRRALASLMGVLVARSVAADLVPSESVAAPEPPTSAKAASVDVPPMRASTGSRDPTATPQPQLQSPSQPPQSPSHSQSQSQPQSSSQPLQWLSAPFTRAGASRELRAGIVDAYAALFDALGEATLAQHYATIAGHIVGDLGGAATAANTPASSEAEVLGVRNICAWLLRVPLAGRLPLQAKREAAQALWDRWLAPGETKAGKMALLLVLHEWRRLPIHRDAADSSALLPPLERLLAHPSPAVRIAVAAAIRHVLEEHKLHAAPVLSSLITRFQRLSADCAVDASATDRAHLCLGYAQAIAAGLSATASVSADSVGCLPPDLAEWTHAIAVRLLDAAYDTDPASTHKTPVTLRNLRSHAGWTLLTALVASRSATPLAQRNSIAEYQRLWAAALPLQTFVTVDMSWLDRAHQLQSRTMALTHLLAVLRRQTAADGGWQLPVSERTKLVTSLRFAVLFADNALDAPPPASSPSFDPARPVRQLPVATSLLASHLELRCRVLECLQALGDRALLAPTAQAAVGLAEQCLASPDNLSEMHAKRMAAAAGLDQTASPSMHTAAAALPSDSDGASAKGKSTPDTDSAAGPPITCMRGFRSGAWGYEIECGVTSLLSTGEQNLGTFDSDAPADRSASTIDFAVCALTADEFDWVLTLCSAPPPPSSSSSSSSQKTCAKAYAPYTRLADAAVGLLGHLLPGLAESAQLALLDSLVLALNRLPFNSHRYVAVLTNILAALHASLTAPLSPDVAPAVARAMVEITRAALILPSPAHRRLAGEIVGLLAARTRDAATAYLPRLLDQLTHQAIRSRDRFARAGAAVALGALYARAGSIVAGRMLRQVVSLLHSLASDNDPIVHTWAIGALADAAMSAGYMFEPHARDTFQLVLKLFLSDSHTVPMFACALWLGGKEHTPPNNSVESSGAERPPLPVRSAADPAVWPRRAGVAAEGAAIVASGRDAAVTHPDSTTHHGRANDDAHHHHAMSAHADYRFVCARDDVDAHDARAALGHLVGSLILVFGPELQVDEHTRGSVLTLLSELRRSLPSVGVPVPALSASAAGLSTVVDPDARWQTAAEYIFAVQKQLLFFPPRDDNGSFIPLFIRQTLRPILQTRRLLHDGDISGLHSLQRVAAQALEGVLRLYGERVIETLTRSDLKQSWNDWSLSDVVWEALALYSLAFESVDADLLATDLCTLVQTAVGLSLSCNRSEIQSDDVATEATSPKGILSLVATLCIVFTNNSSGAQPTLSAVDQLPEGDSAALVSSHVRPFNPAAQTMAAAGLIAILDAVARVRTPMGTHSSARRVTWRSHPLLSHLADLLRVGYLAASAPAEQSPELSCLGQSILQRVLAHFSDVEDPAMPGEGIPVLTIFQAQISSAFMPVLSTESPQSATWQAAMDTAAAYVVSGLVADDRVELVRVLRLIAPQPLFDPEGNADEIAQVMVVSRLAVLRAWAVICAHACHSSDRQLLDIIRLHADVLYTGWLDAVRDAAVLDMDPVDVYEELDLLLKRAQKNPWQTDIGIGLALGLESPYVDMLRAPLKRWYQHCLPRLIDTLSLVVDSDSMADALKKRSDYKPALLVLGSSLQMLGSRHRPAGPVYIAADSLPVHEIVTKLTGALDLDELTATAASPGVPQSLLLIIRRLLDGGEEYGLADAFVPKVANGSLWLANEVWMRAVGNVLGRVGLDQNTRAAALDVAKALLSLLSRIQSPPLLAQWLFESIPSTSSDLVDALGLTDAGRMVLRDIIDTIQHAQRSPGTTAECLDMLSVVASTICSRDEYSVAARALVTLWLGLWRQSIGNMCSSGVSAAVYLSDSLAGLVSRTTSRSQVTSEESKDLVSGNDGPDTLWVGEMVSSVLLRMLGETDECSLFVLVIVANFVSSDAQSFAPAAVQAQFASSFVNLLSRSAPSSEDKQALYGVFAALGRSTQPLSVMTLLARESIPVLARLAYRQDEQSAGDLDNVLAALTMFATSKRYSTSVQGQADMAMAAVLMLLLSMLPESNSADTGGRLEQVQIAETILGLATAAPTSFKSILLKLSASQPEAKKRLESAIRSRSTAAPASSSASTAAATEPNPVEVVGIEATKTISLKSDFNI